MAKIVIKIGGSNLKDTAGVRKVVNTIRNYNRPVVVVVSAFFGITNQLQDMLHKVGTDREKIDWLTSFLTEMKTEIVNAHIINKSLKDKTISGLKERLKKLEYYLLGIHYIGEAPDFVEDVVLSYGERLSSFLLTAILQENGIDCEEKLPEDMGLYTDGEFGNATVDFDLSTQPVSAALAADKTIVVPGFYGIAPNRKVTLLGRGGSDYSAAAIARCINAESLDVWKDVDGFLSADPKFVKNPVLMEVLNYTEAAELAYFGAKILHPRTVEPLLDSQIPIRLFNIDKEQDVTKPSSIICETGKIRDRIIKSVTYSDDFAVLKLIGPGVGIKPGILHKVTTELDNKNINIKSVITAQTAINFLLSANDLQRAYEATKNLNLSAVSNIITQKSLSLIALVGDGILENPGIAGKAFGAMSRKGINIQIISLGASPVTAYFLVDRKDRDSAIEEIHREFFN